jgi:glutamine phosphoribosylpyrophosphate amidotransferase
VGIAIAPHAHPYVRLSACMPWYASICTRASASTISQPVCACLSVRVSTLMRPRPRRRPLVLGRRESPDGDEWAVASEDCAFGPIGFERVRDVRPGEMIVITPQGELLTRQCVEVRDTL